MVNYTVSKFHTCTRLKKFVGNRNIREVLQEQREVLQLTSINGTCMRKLTTRKCHTYWLLTTAVHSKVASALRGCLCVLISLLMSVMRAETVDSSAVVPRTGEEAGGCIDLTGNHGDECALHARWMASRARQEADSGGDGALSSNGPTGWRACVRVSIQLLPYRVACVYCNVAFGPTYYSRRPGSPSWNTLREVRRSLSSA